MMPEDENPLQRAVEVNQQRRADAFAMAKKSGAQWLVESRDLWDADDDDAGVYFTPCKDAATVDKIVQEQPDTSRDNRILGIYSLNENLLGQGGGMTRKAWLKMRAKNT